MIRLLETATDGAARVLSALTRRPDEAGEEVLGQVRAIVEEVRRRGDQALLEFTKRFDGVALEPRELAVSAEEWADATRALEPALAEALETAARRIEAFHRHQLPRSWWVRDEHGSLLGQQVTPLDRVGCYIPGGSAAYPSTVLMSVIPARVAGVREIVLATPPGPDGRASPAVLAAARLAGVQEAYKMGGAQAIAALAYGTESIRPVDKVVGPGNLYVALAKRLVFGRVGIDLIAGPSEVVVVADESAEAAWVAADLLAQAEHDPLARAVCLTPSRALAEAVRTEAARQLPALPRRAIAAQALAEHGAVVLTRDLAEAVELANGLAPEHLELLVADPFAWLGRVRHAGAIFLGRHTPEVVGDYVAGPNHVLPTAGTARFASALSVEEFVKRSSVIHYSPAGLRTAWPHLAVLADAEGLRAHREAARIRLDREARD
ncbi:MAG: histidinol dehydrogenase [Candidatus Rokubacteria bacterium]|nr:histidinol dehydrogenase [Candidatus Rokubacteria bacterium]